jgi:triosephosphate isomerase
MRKKLIAGNWKMNMDIQEGLQLASEVFHMAEAEIHHPDMRLILAPPFIHLDALSRRKPASLKLALAAQNCSSYDHGAYTGEVSAGMIQSLAVEYVILGHSERRSLFGDTDEVVAEKMKRVLEQELKPILCVGEELHIREKGTHEVFVAEQLEKALAHVKEEAVDQVVIAYEPVWAIGTGKTASPEQAQEMHSFLRSRLAALYGDEKAGGISILYGGSCKPDNAAAIFEGPDVDGGLIGGASLKSRDFLAIAQAMQNQLSQ